MPSLCRPLDDDVCPVSAHVLAQLYSANECSLPGLLEAIDPEIKPELAFFCYRLAKSSDRGFGHCCQLR